MTDQTRTDCNADDVVVRLLNDLATGQQSDAYSLIEEVLASGWDVEAVITDLLAEVQRLVGSRWQAGDWTIAAEHASTAMIDDLLGALGSHVSVPTSQGTVALVCAEGEWHVTPARMAALLLRAGGWRTTFMGGSTPTAHLAQEFSRKRPTFVAISCTNILALPGAARVAQACRKLGIPTIAGGAAFGFEPLRAQRLGIDGWAQDARSASAVLEGWMDAPPEGSTGSTLLQPSNEGDEYLWASLVERTLQHLANVAPSVRDDRAPPLHAVRRDLTNLLRTAYVAGICDDPTVFREYLTWLSGVHPAQGLPHDAIQPSVSTMLRLGSALDPHLRAVLATVALDD